MFNSSILDMLILLVFTYFICSVMLSVLVEMVSTIFNLRSKELEKNLNSFFFEDGVWTKYVSEKIKASPFYQSLQKDAKKNPSYMPAENFAKAIMESLRNNNEPITISSVQTALKDNTNKLPENLRKVLLGYLDTAEDDVKNLQKQIETFYDNAMDRANGWYKAKIKKYVSIPLSILLVFLLNIDTIEIIQKSTQNPSALKDTVDNISAQVPKMKFGKDEITFIDPKTLAEKTIKIDTSASSVRELKQQYADFNVVKGQLQNNVYSIGYKEFSKDWTSADYKDNSVAAVFLKIFGMILTILALQVGSTYWFDMLNKVINLRGTGKKPEPAK